ncbi:MAG: divalent metal cation transporter, partial [Lutibacter sp.]|nr:divalent metal cation transporter [Lutibacter sp.]
AGLAANLFGITSNPVSWSVFITLACFLLLIIGKYRLLDKLMKAIILVLTVSTLASLFIATVHTTDPVSFQQVLPEGTVAVSFLIAFLGWMPAPLDVAVWQSLWTLEKQRENKDKRTLKEALFDFNIGYVGTLILGVCFVGLGALVLFNSTTSLSNSALDFSQQLVSLYTDNLGKEMHLLIAIAAFTTMFSTTITTLDASPRAMHKTTDLLLRRPLKNGYWYWILFLAAGTLILLAFFLSEMGRLVSIATILSFLTAPFYAIMNYWLISGKHTPVHARPSTGLKVLSYTGIIFLIGFGIWYLSSL